jgi:hypothetical protein
MLEETAHRWFQFANQREHPFERFVGLWFTLVIVARMECAQQGDDDDMKIILSWFRMREADVVGSLFQRKEIFDFLRHRRGSPAGQAIIDLTRANIKRRRVIDGLATWLGHS